MSPDELQKQHESAEEKSFADILSEFETATRKPPKAAAGPPPKRRGRSRAPARPPLRGTVVSIAADFVLIDYGAKAEGVIPRADLLDAEGNLDVQVGDTFDVAITNVNRQGEVSLSRVAGPRPRDWEGLSRAFEDKMVIAGRVTAMIKGGFSVDVGARAFLPASRSGVRDAADMEKLVGQEIRCRIIKLDVDDEDIVIDRRSVLEEDAEEARRKALETLQEGAVVHGVVRSLMSYGAFLDVGGVDGLLHVGDISWARVTDPSTELKVGDALDVKVLKVDPQTAKISLGLKQMSPDPWEAAAAKLQPGDRVTGEVTKLMDFGAFVEVLPGVEGLIHVSEMSWTKRVHRPGDVLKLGERVEAVVLKVDTENSRLSLGLKQVLGNPWDTIRERYPAGKIVEGKVTRLAQFGAFVELEEGVDGLVHVSEFTSERRIQSPGEFVKIGQMVRAAVISADPENRRLKLSMKQLEATAADQFAEDAAVGDRVTGRVIAVRGNEVRVQLGEGVEGICVVGSDETPQTSASLSGMSLADQLAAVWKGTAKPPSRNAPAEPYEAGQLRSFIIRAIDAAAKRIELTPA
ncbi:MAG TPA: 30S ribosomal protein S1 [Terriglobia bacterium]|nr:30S ribosomal protein S1 [Terriglobia bacterium]